MNPLLPTFRPSPRAWIACAGLFLLAGAGAEAHTLANGARLLKGQSVISRNGRFQLEFRQDGKLAVYRLPDPAAPAAERTLHWETSRPGFTGPGTLAMQADNNLVCHDSAGAPRWHTGTRDPHPRSAAHLSLADDGTPRLLAGTRLLWDSSREAATLQPGDAVTVRIVLPIEELRAAVKEAGEEEDSKCVVQ